MNIIDTANKPVVYFKELTGFVDFKGKGIKALLSSVTGHPELGDEDEVHTSLVKCIKHDPVTLDVIELETLNTRYIKEV